uniref:Exocyst complex component 2 n=1 Tax=Megaselia scalaris TaxID=36166 RepID=T1GPX0_MEGSC
MGPQPVVTGLSPKEGPPGTRVTIRGEYLGSKASDLVGLTICGTDCLLSAEWKSPNKIIARTGPAKGKGYIIVTTASGGVGTSTVQFLAYHETIGPLKECAVWIEESPSQNLSWGRRTHTSTVYTQEDPLGLSIEGNEQKIPGDLRDLFPDCSGDLSQEGQLSFLKSNAGSVIDQLDTLMNIKEKFEEDLKISGPEPLKIAEESIQKSITESHNIFNDVLERKEKADSTRAAFFALSRHKFLFCLSNSVDRSAAAGDYDVVVNDYSRAKNLFGKTDIPIFKKVMEEVDNRVLNIRKQLFEKVTKMPQSVEQQKKLIKALISLESQQIGTSVGDKLRLTDPAWSAIDARAKYLEATFKQTFDQYTTKDGNQEKSKTRYDPNVQPNRAAFCEEICEIAASHLPDLWRLGQSYFTGELRGINDPKPGDFKRMILTSIEKALRQTTGLSWAVGSNSLAQQFMVWIPQCLRYIRISYATLIHLDLPSEALDIIQKLIDEVRLFSFNIIFKRAIDKVKKLAEKETWIMGVEDFPGATLLPSALEEIIVETLEEGQNACMNPEIREGNLLEPQSEGQREVSQRLQDMLHAFCGVIEKLAQTQDDENHTPIVSQLLGFPNTSGLERGSSMTWEQRILCCLANCSYCHKIFFTHIGTVFVKYGYPLPKLAIETSRITINQLFMNLLEEYVEHKNDPLVGTIEPSMYLGNFTWESDVQLGKLRPYAQECIDNLVGVYSEIYTISPALLRPVLEPIVQTVAEELARLMNSMRLYSNETAKNFFCEAIEAIPQLSAEQAKKVEELLEEVKENMKLQTLCFKIQNP